MIVLGMVHPTKNIVFFNYAVEVMPVLHKQLIKHSNDSRLHVDYFVVHFLPVHRRLLEVSLIHGASLDDFRFDVLLEVLG